MVRGNILLRAAGEVVEYTKEQIQEYIRCKEDILYFAEKYVKIVTIDRGLELIKLWDFQKEMILALKNPPKDKRHPCILASRQVGKSTICRIFLLHYILFNEDKTVAILANKEKTAIKLMKELKDAYQRLPYWLQVGVKDGGWNKTTIELENEMNVICSSTSSDACRSFTISLLVLDEFAFVPDHIATEFISSVYPTISSGKTSRIFCVSTPNGLNHFHQIWRSANDDPDSEYYPIKIDWDRVPGRDEDFKRKTIANLPGGIVQWNSEFGNKFIGSTNNLVDPDILENIKTDKPIALKFNDRLLIYKFPEKGKEYILGIDTAAGTGLDHSVIQVLEINGDCNLDQVAVFRDNKIEINEFAEVCVAVSEYYNDGQMMVENDGVGQALTNTIFYNHENENLINLDPKGLGINANKKTKSEACTNLKKYVEEKWLKIHDQTTLYELSRFIEIRKNVFQCQEKDGHDDTVSGLYWAVYYLKTPYYDPKSNRRANVSKEYDLNKETEEPPVIIFDEGDSSSEMISYY